MDKDDLSSMMHLCTIVHSTMHADTSDVVPHGLKRRGVRLFFFQAEDGIRDPLVLEFRRVLFRSDSLHNGLHQNRWKPNRLPFSRRLSNAAHELEELCGADDRVRNRGSLDQIFLSHLRAEVTADRKRVVKGRDVNSGGWGDREIML